MMRLSKNFNVEQKVVSDDECSKIFENENDGEHCPYNRFQYTSYLKSIADTCNSYMKMTVQ